MSKPSGPLARITIDVDAILKCSADPTDALWKLWLRQRATDPDAFCVALIGQAVALRGLLTASGRAPMISSPEFAQTDTLHLARLRAAPGEGFSRPSSGAAYIPPRALPLNDEGDLVDLPAFSRRAPTRFTDDATLCEAEKGREGMPSGAFPLPQGPP